MSDDRPFRVDCEGIGSHDALLSWAHDWDDAVRMASEFVNGASRTSCSIYDTRIDARVAVGRVALRVTKELLDFRPLVNHEQNGEVKTGWWLS
jgi:hypothetical protein